VLTGVASTRVGVTVGVLVGTGGKVGGSVLVESGLSVFSCGDPDEQAKRKKHIIINKTNFGKAFFSMSVFLLTKNKTGFYYLYPQNTLL
jgi:hypothetical protein